MVTVVNLHRVGSMILVVKCGGIQCMVTVVKWQSLVCGDVGKVVVYPVHGNIGNVAEW